MATYVSLFNWTEQGVKNVKDTVKRAQQFRAETERRGIKVLDLYWTQGRYDLVVVFEAPDEQTATACLLALGSLGNAHSETLRAFNENEMNTILQKV